MKRFIIMLVAFCAALSQSCTDAKSVEEKLRNAEVKMEEYPKQAFEILKSIKQPELTTRKVHAKYALLMSMALDKNYIDVANDSIIKPAVKYYQNHGNADDRLKTCYYWGRIAMNAGEYEDAISRFTVAERYAEKASDKVALGRLYKAQTGIYQYCYDTDAMIEVAEKAADLYLELGDTEKYLASLFDITAGYLNKVDTINARKTLVLIKEDWDVMDDRLKSQYFANQLILYGHTSTSHLCELLSEYEKEIVNRQLIQWLAVAKAYYICEDYGKASDAIKNFEYYGGVRNDVYYWIAGLVYEALGQHPQAMRCYKNYIEQTDGKLGYLLEADIRFVKERYETQIKITRRNYLLRVQVLCAMVLFLSSLLVVNRIKRIKRERKLAEEKLKFELRAIEAEQKSEKIRYDKEIENQKAEIDKYMSMYDSALSEIENLNETLKNNTLDMTVRTLVGERLSLLNKFIASNMTPNYSLDAATELQQLMRDKNHFIESTRISFLIEHPQFIRYLKKRDLSDGEIGYCCLYTMGLKGKDISAYMGKGHYKLSSAIRKKLGLSEHDTNLDIFLREILAETAS